MSWARISDDFFDHPKIDRLLETEGRRGMEAVGLYLLALSYCGKHLTDGALSARAILRLDPEAGLELAAALERAGLFDAAADGGYRVHDYLDANDSRAAVVERRRKETERKAAMRAAKADDDRTSRRVSRRDRQRDSQRGAAPPSALPHQSSPVLNDPPNPPEGGLRLPRKPRGNRASDQAAYEAALADFAVRLLPDHEPAEALRLVKSGLGTLRTSDATAEQVRAEALRWAPDSNGHVSGVAA